MRTALLVTALLFVSSVLALSEQEYQDAFRNWTAQYTKVYINAEFSHRYNVFKSNLDYVNAWNAEGTPTILDTNFFADLTNEEYKNIYLGTKFDATARIRSAQRRLHTNFVLANAPDAVNWTAQGAVTPIKDQGQCGSCWSFSATGSTESIHFIKTKNLVSLSEQNLIDCSVPQGNNGCNGGIINDAFKYIISNNGIDTEASYPYTATGPNNCTFNPANVGATIKTFTDVPAGSESALLTAVVAQPVSLAIDAGHKSFQLYKSGVYYENACSSIVLDHGVLAVGYGTDSNKPYWLVKNSWGTSWGLQGYIWMARDDKNQCGVATLASYPTM